MKIVLIGAGNVATHLGEVLYQANHQMLQVYSRNEANAHVLANRINAQAISQLTDVNTHADIYILSVIDDALEAVIQSLPPLNGIVVHTAGSVSMDVLARFSKHGVFYPFQTFTKGVQVNFNTIPILIESEQDEVNKKLTCLAQELSSSVLQASSHQRGQLHIAAVYACNFVNHMYRLADEVLQKSDLPFSLLHPLIKETADKVQRRSPEKTQTGPAARNDQQIITKHLDALKDNEELYAVYKQLTQSILKRL